MGGGMKPVGPDMGQPSYTDEPGQYVAPPAGTDVVAADYNPSTDV